MDVPAERDSTRMQRWQALDGLRAMAILLVLAFHSDQTGLFRGGSLGVDLFFVLSGFLITEQLAGRPSSLSQFLMRRVARLWPTLTCLVLFATAIGIAEGGSIRANIPAVFYIYNEMVARHFRSGMTV